MTSRRTILLSGGGTLGPVTPLLAVARRLREREPDVDLAWVGTSRGPERELVGLLRIPFHAIPSGKFRRYFSLRNLTDLFRILAGTAAAVALLRRIRPCAVVSAGGFVAVPVVWAAALLRVPVHVHQQDWRPGLANRLSFPYAASVSVALEKSVADFGGRATWTGNPVRPEVLAGDAAAARRRFAINEERPVLLALGGGTGAAALNDAIVAALPALAGTCVVLHVTGKGKATDAAGDGYRQVEFIADGMGDAYALADLVVTRAGMGTLTELAALGKPAIVAPMPGTHQEDNAALFVEAGAARSFDGATQGPSDLAAAVKELLSDRTALSAMSAAMRRMNPSDAADRVADAVMRLCREP